MHLWFLLDTQRWSFNMVAVLFAMGKQHCVDDLLNVERTDTCENAHSIWMCFCKLLGWDVPSSKTPEPEDKFVIIGVNVD